MKQFFKDLYTIMFILEFKQLHVCFSSITLCGSTAAYKIGQRERISKNKLEMPRVEIFTRETIQNKLFQVS